MASTQHQLCGVCQQAVLASVQLLLLLHPHSLPRSLDTAYCPPLTKTQAHTVLQLRGSKHEQGAHAAVHLRGGEREEGLQPVPWDNPP